ncbi:hypothetical protein Afil01_09940 [Actinorhabdospora filicis]|uniref:Peptidase inhibitor family I36 n=1 Tax=Actinorhabdospora filicis TaxID=1785913 RepID=A0A9W6SI04_9ACTN|nr:peptidase inhibitor family I36 protein [Actinorhabdospora filicis]GLZ76187.1 hypothetical protein Afil01_09940 [Actinorhabdospora filicis]
MSKTMRLVGWAVAVALAIAVAPPASAALTEDSCDSERFCVWNPDGRKLSLSNGAYDLNETAGGVLNDAISWATNNSGYTWCLYADAGYRGDYRIYASGYDGDTDEFGWQVSSLRAEPWYGC